MLPSRMLSLFAISVVVVFVVTPQAIAATPSCAEEKVCSEIAQRAMKASRDKDWQAARTLYEQAYRQVPEPELLLNIGRCWHKLGQCDRAKEQYRLYRTQVRQPSSEAVETLQRFELEANSICQAQSNRQIADVAKQARQPAPSIESGPLGMQASGQSPPTAPASTANVGSSSFRLHKKWWFWTLLGTAAAGAAAGVAVGLAPQQPLSDMQQDTPKFPLTFEPKR